MLSFYLVTNVYWTWIWKTISWICLKSQCTISDKRIGYKYSGTCITHKFALKLQMVRGTSAIINYIQWRSKNRKESEWNWIFCLWGLWIWLSLLWQLCIMNFGRILFAIDTKYACWRTVFTVPTMWNC